VLKKLALLLITLSLMLAGTTVFAAGGTQPSIWATEIVNEAIKLKIVPERLQSKYQSPITREEYAELIVNAVFAKVKRDAETTESTEYWTPEKVFERVTLDFEFEDARQDHVKLAFILGAVNGVSATEFAPDKFITRQEAAVMLMNTSHLSGFSYTDNTVMGYSDYDQIADWAKPAVEAAWTTEFMRGVGNKFDYAGLITREQAIITVMKLYRHPYLFALRGNLNVKENFYEFHYHIGRDYIKVNFTGFGEDSSPLKQFVTAQWRNNPFTHLDGDRRMFTEEKAVVIYGFTHEIRATDFPNIIIPTLHGDPVKLDYGYMEVYTYQPDSLIMFKYKPIHGFVRQVPHYEFGYPLEQVTVEEIKQF